MCHMDKVVELFGGRSVINGPTPSSFCCFYVLWILWNFIGLLGMTWLALIWIDLTWLDLTLPDLSLLDLTWIELTWLDLNWLDLTWLDLTWFNLTWLHRLKWLISPPCLPVPEDPGSRDSGPAGKGQVDRKRQALLFIQRNILEIQSVLSSTISDGIKLYSLKLT